MIKTVIIHQPDFLSYLGFFHRLLHADQFVILDHVQYVTGTSRSWMNRDRIKTATGSTWLTVSVEKCPRGTPINEVRLSSRVAWRENNLNLLSQNYAKAPYFREIHPRVEQLYRTDCSLLVEFNMASIRMLCDMFGINIDLVFSSELDCGGKSNEMLVNILTDLGASHYLSGLGAKGYYDPEPFKAAGIEVIWQDFKHPIYPQMFGEFAAGLSAIDLLYNCGLAESGKILREC